MTSMQVSVAQAPRPDAVNATPLAARLNVVTRVADEARAHKRLDDFVSHLNAADASALNLIKSERARALLLAIADHSSFLWRLITSDPARLEELLRTAPETQLDDVLSGLVELC